MLSFIPFTVLCQTLTEEEKSGHIGYIFFQVMSFITISLLIVREMTQAMLSLRQYVTNYSNWIDICLMSSTIVILVFEGTIPNHASRILRTCIILLATAEYFNMLGMVSGISKETTADLTELTELIVKLSSTGSSSQHFNSHENVQESLHDFRQVSHVLFHDDYSFCVQFLHIARR
jgi:hypothetical protein